MILLLAPEAPERGDLAAVIEQLGQDVEVRAPAGLASAGSCDAIVLDLAAGQDALRFLRRHGRTPVRAPVVCIADRRRADASSEALRLGAVDIVGRPVTRESLAAALGNARDFVQLRTDPEVPPPPAESTPAGIFGPSPAMRSVLGLARRVGPSRCSVLLVGERGTGREMVARAIHAAGAHTAQQFYKVSCSAITAAELRSVVDSAEPDATIYLENLGELPSGLQLKVEDYLSATPALHPGTPRRGDGEPHAPRFIGAAQPRIWSLIDRGDVRRELIDALAIVRIDLPPLRQRPEDVAVLALHFVKDACRQNGVPPKTFTPSALTLLRALPWPGNASELKSLCERLAVLVTRGVILLEDVVANVRFAGAETVGRSRETLKVARERFERDHIASVLQHHKGRMGAAARELGIERTNLYRKIKQLGIRWEGEPD